MSRLIVVTGVPASGKSTVAAALARRSARGVVVDGDMIRAGVVSGRVDMSPDADPEALRQLRLRYQASLAVARVYLDGGFDVVFNDNVLGPMLGELPGLVPWPRFHLVVLDPGPATVLQRDRAREKTAYGEGHSLTVDVLYHLLARETPRMGLWLDNAHQTPNATVDEVLARLDEALVPALPGELAIEDAGRH